MCLQRATTNCLRHDLLAAFANTEIRQVQPFSRRRSGVDRILDRETCR
jgi:hypothetical protein